MVFLSVPSTCTRTSYEYNLGVSFEGSGGGGARSAWDESAQWKQGQ